MVSEKLLLDKKELFYEWKLYCCFDKLNKISNIIIFNYYNKGMQLKAELNHTRGNREHE